jgi:hypothetical protein
LSSYSSGDGQRMERSYIDETKKGVHWRPLPGNDEARGDDNWKK